MVSLDRHNSNIGGHGQRGESQSWARFQMRQPAVQFDVVAASLPRQMAA